MSLTISPDALNLKCVYTLLSSASHHDPTLGVDANINLYNRQLIRVPFSTTGRSLSDSDIQRISAAFPVPEEVYPIFLDEPFARFVAIALVKVFIEKYGRVRNTETGDWGTGLFTGIEAYTRLQNRIELAAPRSVNLKDFWNQLLKDMQCGTVSDTRELFSLLSLPVGFHHEVLYHFSQASIMVTQMAREWVLTKRLASKEYAEKSKREASSGRTEVIDFSSALNDESVGEISIAVPVHSGNDIRHDIRNACMLHLFAMLGLGLESRLPTGVKSLFENGGNIGKGKSAPSRFYELSQTIRATYPSLGLLGGCTDTFLLGDSNLHSVLPFWFGREYNESLKHIFGVTADHSVTDMIDNWELFRHSGRTHDVSPMPYNFEVISAGAKLYVSFQFSPYTTELELGAFWCGLRTFIDIDASIGGQSAKGFGRVKVDVHDGDVEAFELHAEAYETYLQQHLIELSEGLQTGQLGTDIQVCS